MEYGLVSGSDILWQTESTFKDLKADTSYSFVFRMSYDPQTQMPSAATEPVSAATLKSAAAAPAAPVMKERTETSITVETAEQQEYAIKINGTLSGWQKSGEFTGLNPGTSYSIVTRMTYDPQTAMESLSSEPLNVKTIIAFSGSSISGITANATYDAGSSFTVRALGTGMDNTAPCVGDSRWKPASWTWGSGAKGSWDTQDYSMAFSVKEAGKYTLNVVFNLETYTSNGWENAGEQRTLTTSFNVVAKEFTMKATATKGGTISPSGTMTIIQAQDYTFTMTPDKNYKIAHLYIDGKEVKVNGTKYTFESVNGDHSIYVVFERDGNLDAPKTGDDKPLGLWRTLAGISLVVIVGVIVIRIFKTRKEDR